MALLTGPSLASVGRVGDIDTVRRNPLGARAVDGTNGNEYVYLAGVASCVANDAVTYNATTYVAVRIIADAVGMVAVAPAAILAANWGWFQIYGFGTVNSDAIGGAGGVFIDGTTGRVDTTSVPGDFVNGMLATAAHAANKTVVQMNYPYVTNTVPA